MSAIDLPISSIELQISSNRLNCRYLQLNCRYLQFNCRYLQFNYRYLQFNWRYLQFNCRYSQIDSFSPLETISTSLWASLYHHLPVLSVFSHVNCQFVFAHIFSVVVDPSPSRPPLLLFPGTTMSIICLDKLSFSLLVICPYRFNRFCLRNVDIWHTLASSYMLWFLTWSFLVLPLIHRSILIIVCYMQSVLVFLSNRPTFCSICHCWLDHGLIHLVFQFDGYLFVA